MALTCDLHSVVMSIAEASFSTRRVEIQQVTGRDHGD
jgi:hypothetical protein